MKDSKRLKRFTVCVLSMLISISTLSCNAVWAKDDELISDFNKYTSGDYTFEKLSHSDKPRQSPDGIVDYIGNGEVKEYVLDQSENDSYGDRGQSYSWSAVTYGDYVYVGTCYAAMGNTLKLMDSVLGDKFDVDVMRATLNTIFNGTFFYGQEDGVDSGGILVKVNINTGETELLMSKSTTGQSPLFRNAIEYNDKLYFCGSVSSNGFGLPSIYEVDPKTDQIQEVYTGLTLQEYAQAYKEGICTGIRGMTVYNNQLVVSCVGLEGPYIMITSNPSDRSSFKVIANKDDLFNYPAYHYEDSIYGGSIWEIASYNGSLYVAMCTGTPNNKPDEHTMQSFAIVRGDENSDGTWQWTSVIGDKEKDGAKYTFGIDPERTRAGACNMVIYNDYLYIGEYEDIEIALEDVLFNTNVEFLAKNLEQSVNLYRMDKNENIELIVGDATKMFPDGGLSGIGSGFGHHENQYIWQSVVYEGKLYLGTFDSSSLLEPIGQFTNGDLINREPEEWKTQIDYIKVLLELLAQKNNTGSNFKRVRESNSQENVAAMVEEAIDLANKRYGTMASSTYSKKNESSQKKISLTSKQKDQLVSDILDGTIIPGTLGTKTTEELVSLNEKLISCYDYLDEKGSKKFIDLYEEIYHVYKNSEEKVPDVLKELYNKLLNLLTIDNLRAFKECLKYLATATRGFDMYVTNDGINFETITTDGFNDPYNHGLRVFATSDDWMVVGTANPFYGTQLWRMKGSKTALGKLIKEAEKYVEESYTVDSWEVFKKALDEANDVMNNGNALESDVKGALDNLTNATEQLVLSMPVNKIALQIAVDTANTLKDNGALDEVVPAVVAEFERALNNAETVLADNKADQTTVDSAFYNLANAIHKLGFIKGDKSALEALIKEAEKYEEENYTTDSWTALQDALNGAKDVINNDNALQEEVEEAYNSLKDAIANLVIKADKTRLQALYDMVNGLDKSLYIEATVANLTDPMASAKDVLESVEATQDEVDTAYEALTRAYLDLRLIPNKDLLQELINKAQTLNAANYSDKTWSVVTNVLEKARTVLNDPKASQVEVDAAKDVLAKALSELQEVKLIKADDATASVKTGDTRNLLYPFIGLTIASVVFCKVRKREN